MLLIQVGVKLPPILPMSRWQKVSAIKPSKFSQTQSPSFSSGLINFGSEC